MNHKKVLALVMSTEKLSKVAEHQGQFSEIEDDIVQLVNSSMVGARLFEASASRVVSEQATKVMDSEIEKLCLLEVIDAAALMKSEQGANATIVALPGSELIPARRTVTLNYRGRKFQHRAKSIQDEIDMRYMTRIKSMAVNCGDLAPLHCESKLVTGGAHAGLAGQISHDLLGRCRAARTLANRGLSKLEQKGSSHIIKWLNRNKKALTLSDSTFWVELQFMVGMQGEDGEAALHAAVFVELDQDGKVLDIAAVLVQVKMILESDLCLFCDESAQNNVADVVRRIADLEAGRCPKWPAKMCEFMQQVRSSISLWCTCQSDTNVLVGQPAADHLAKAVMKKNADAVTAEDLKEPLRFAWLLSPAQKKALDTLRQNLIETQKAKVSVVASRGSSVGGSSSSAGPPAAKKKGTSELDAAMAAFKGKKKAV